MKLIARADWGARKPSGNLTYLPSARGVKVHYMGSRVSPELAGAANHDRCVSLVRRVQADHMDGNDWTDIAYNFIVCPHGDVFEGRGLHRLSAANGPGLNQGHYAVLALLGNAGLTQPTDAMLNGIREAITYCRNRGQAGTEIKGHRDGYNTDCPGKPLYAWIKAGAPRPGSTGSSGGKTPTTEDIVKKLPTLGKGAKSSEHMQTLRALLRARSHPEVGESGPFDAVVEAAVKDVQKWGGVTDDGIVGGDTWPVLLRVH